MSSKSDEDEVCACCGIAAVDDVKLEECNDGCDLVKYCSDKCCGNHREEPKAELRDKDLFAQPDGSHLGECPICFLPLSLDITKSSFHSCCCKLVCNGCIYADKISSGKNNCPFCREPTVNGEEENIKRVMKRVKVNDPAALNYMGRRRYQEGDYDKAAKYWTDAVKLGDRRSFYHLGILYYDGHGVKKDLEKAIHHWEEAAIGGHPFARHNVAHYEEKNGNIERAVKHFIIAANLGYEESMKVLWKYYSAGGITKEELEATLRTHKAAIDETKSAQRDAAEVLYAYRQHFSSSN